MNEETGHINQEGEEKAKRVAGLIAGYLRQTLSEEEHDELDEWMTASDDNQRLFEELTDIKNIEEGMKQMKSIDPEKMLKKIKERIPFNKTGTKKRTQRRWAYGVAASIILIAGTLIVSQMIFRKYKKEIITKKERGIEPGGNKATLTLSNGKIIDLEDAKKGLIDSSSGSDVLKTAEGQLSYENPEGRMLVYHTLTTPAGGQYSVLLPDGSRVWLNASSSLKYPVAFTGKERVVELEGEGYFEVTHLTPTSSQPSPEGEGVRKTPFIVKINKNVEVEVTGTKFNINAYSDEKYIATTLLEGKVRVGSPEPGADVRELFPGEQAKAGSDGELEVEKGVNTETIIAWTKGQFKFSNAPIEEIMRQVARWYNAEIIYEGKVDYHFNATTIYRSEPLSKLLEILEATNRVHFKIEGRKIIVRP